MPSVTLKRTARPDKFAIMVVNNANGSFNREVRLTEQEYSDFRALPSGIPPGVTRQEWVDGKSYIVGKALDVGDVEEKGDGSLLVKFAERTISLRTIETFLKLGPGEWTGTPPAITIPPAVITAIVGRTALQITACIDGVLTWQ